MTEGPDTDALPPDDDTPAHTLARFRQLLRQRKDEPAVRLLDASDRLYTAQVRASKAVLPEERILALVQALTYSTESHLITLQEGYGYLDRLAAALQPADTWSDSAHRLEAVATDWEARLSAAHEVWARAGNEIPRQVAEASAQVLRSALEETRTAVRRLFFWLVILAGLSLAASVFAWRTYAVLMAAVAQASDSRSDDAKGP